MRRILNIALFCLLYQFSFAQVVASDPADVFKAANDAYGKGEYETAIQNYKSILDQGYESYKVYYNLGNAYYKLGEVGPSILYYEKALKLEPDNADAQFNLKLANLKVTDRIDPLREAFVVQWIKRLLTSRSANGWTRLAITFIWVAFAFGVLLIFVGNIIVKRVSLLAAVASLILAFAFVLASLWQINYQKKSTDGIIMVTNTYVKSAPSETSVDLFILREGVKVRLLDKSDKWQQVKIVDQEGDKVGWIPVGDVTPI